jgi:hypothetical protein
MRPLPQIRLAHSNSPAQQPLPLPPLFPRGALGIGDGDHRNLDPEVSSPPFSSLSPSLPLPPLLSPCARALFSPLRARVPARRRAPAPPRHGGPPLPFPARRGARPSPFPRGGLAPAQRPAPGAADPAPARPPWPRRGVRPPGAASPAPRRGPCPGVQPPARGLLPLHAASRPPARLAWPRLPPNVFPRAQTHARGDYFWVCS